ncbi:MAG: NAD(+) synthase [Clostridia bacterium]|nr:NAD(+) synthase [Clostridia bacterium]
MAGHTKSVKISTLERILNALSIIPNEDGLKSSVCDYGFIKVGAYTPEIRLANPTYNAKLFEGAIALAEKQGVRLLVFPALSLTGSTLGDIFYQPTLLDTALKALFSIARATVHSNVLSVVGLPIAVEGCLYSVGAVICRGEILGFTPDNYAKPPFSSFNGVKQIIVNGKKYPFGNILYSCKNYANFSFTVEFSGNVSAINPFINSIANKVTISACLTAVAETVGSSERFKADLSSVTRKINVGYVVAGAGYGESTTDCVFAGRNYIYENGNLLKESKAFTSGLTVSDIDVEFLLREKMKNKLGAFAPCEYETVEFSSIAEKFTLSREFEKYPFVPSGKGEIERRAELVLDIQANALKRRIEHVNAKTVVLGVSGGLDSTLALIVCVRAMRLLNRNLKDIVAVTMPCFGTTKRTKNNAVNLANGFGVTLKEINIKNSVLSHFSDIGQDPTVTDVTYENSQARERTQVLMDYANKTGGIVVGTGDLSELALGWATYNGDHMSMYGVNASIPKTLLRYLVGYESSRSKGLMKQTLDDVLATPVSPELVPAKEGEITQKTEDIVGPYTLHDFYLYYAIRRCYSPSKIFYIAKKTFDGEYSPETLYKWLKNFYNRFFNQQFKRSCVPDGVKVGSVSLSPRGEFSMPSDAYKAEWLLELENIKP